MRIVDLTAELYSGMPVYPGDPPVIVESAATVAVDGYAVARLALSDQAGTHVETAAHFIAGGRTLAEEPLERFIGRACVVDVPCRRLTLADLTPHDALVARNPFLLLRSGHTDRAGVFDPAAIDRPILEVAALAWLVERGVRLLGIDSPDFDLAPDYAGHHYLLARGVLVVEGLIDLGALPAECDLFVIPPRVRGTGAAPCRAFAILPD